MKNYKNATNNYLIIVEGEELELNLFDEVFKTIYSNCTISKIVNGLKIENDNSDIISNDSKDHFLIVKPKHNVLSQILKDVNGNPDIIEPYLYFINEDDFDYGFRYVFYVFDIDYTKKKDLLDAFDLFNDPTDRGLLLVSSPCIESLVDFESNCFDLENETGRKISNIYKPLVQKQVQKIVNCGASKFIRDNAFTLFRHCIYRNRTVLGIKDLFQCFYYFQESDFLIPYCDEYCYHFPFVTSFIYIMIAILFRFDTKKNSFDCLDSFLKSFSFHDKNEKEIIECSPFLK